jgi:amino acid adenylation domain-containing protein
MLSSIESKWFINFKPRSNAKLRLFCFSYAGGNPNMFRAWEKFLPEYVEVVALVLPGRYSRIKEPNFTTWPELLDALENAITPYLTESFAFFGHSFGARIIYEFTKLLQNKNKTLPRCLFIAGCRAPHIAGPTPFMYNLPEEEFFARVSNMNGTPLEILNNRSIIKLLEPALRADMELSEPWSGAPNPKLHVPIVAISGIDDHIDYPNSMCVWSSYTIAEFAFYKLKGDHFFIHHNEAELLSILDTHCAMSLADNKDLEKKLLCWNNTHTAYPTKHTIQQAFVEKATKTPHNIALIYNDQYLTYAELNTRSNQLAHFLLSLGLQPNELVAVCLDRSINMVIALLAILKAGGAYLPIDPEYPAERIDYMFQDSKAQILLTQEKYRQQLPNITNVLWAEELELSSKQYPVHAPIVAMSSENLAYVNYTSGSTGNPKGVAIKHKGVMRLLFGIDYVHIDANSVFLQLASNSFDATTFELWGALLHGAKCVLFPEKFITLHKLRQVIAENQVNILFITTALFNLIIDNTPELLLPIKQLLTGGEAHSVTHMRRAMQLLPHIKITSVYGPTESTTFATYFPLEQLSANATNVPIGKPISNTRTYILDANKNLVPIGNVGELYIGGDGLAHGYLNKPELTAEKFISNLVFLPAHERLYKTGDLARYLPNGDIEFLGRVDNQVKLNGFRIELEEIEHHLLSHPKINQAVVMLKTINSENKLAAYVVPKQDNITIQELKQFLAKNLPNYMIPSFVYCIKELPLTINGKVDRKSLSGMVAA